MFLEPDGFVELPLEATYEHAFATVPKRWRNEFVKQNVISEAEA